MIYLKEKKKKIDDFIAKIKIIFKFANKNNDHDLNHLSRMQIFNVESKNVKFFLNNSFETSLNLLTNQIAEISGSKKKSKDKKNGEFNQKSNQNIVQNDKYITVYEFFENDIYFIIVQLNFFVIK